MRYIVAGTSPHIADAPLSLMKENPVIGVNQAYRIPLVNDHMNHWICWDSDERHQNNIRDWETHIRPECKVYMRDDPDGRNKAAQTSNRINYFEASTDEHPMHRKNTEFMYLTMRGSTATTACGLAYMLGATEIILVGIEFMGVKHAFGGKMFCDHPGDNLIRANRFFDDFIIPTYKTKKYSGLNLPYMNLTV